MLILALLVAFAAGIGIGIGATVATWRHEARYDCRPVPPCEGEPDAR